MLVERSGARGSAAEQARERERDCELVLIATRKAWSNEAQPQAGRTRNTATAARNQETNG
jgi:hypothetical protein